MKQKIKWIDIWEQDNLQYQDKFIKVKPCFSEDVETTYE